MIYEIQTIRTIRANLDYHYTVYRFIPDRVTKTEVKHIDRAEAEKLTRPGGFNKLWILSSLGDYEVIQRCIEYPEIFDISRYIKQDEFKHGTLYYNINTPGKFYHISNVQGRITVYEHDRSRPEASTEKYCFKEAHSSEVTFWSIQRDQIITFPMHQLRLIDGEKLHLVKRWEDFSF